MGCCPSKDPSTAASSSPPQNIPKQTTAQGTAIKSKTGSTKGGDLRDASIVKEQQVQLAFKAKRGNVFTASVDDDTRRVFSAQNIPKTQKQEKIISKNWNVMIDAIQKLNFVAPQGMR